MVDIDFLILGLKAIQADGVNGLLLPGLSVVSLDHLPSTLDLVAVYRIRAPLSEAGRFILTEFDVVDERGMSVYAPGAPKPVDVVRLSLDTTEVADDDVCSVRYHTLCLPLSVPGRHSVVLYLDCQEAMRCDFRVSPKPAEQRSGILRRAYLGD